MKTFKTLTLIALMVVICAFAVNAIVAEEGDGYRAGDKASDFYLRNVDNTMMSMKDFRDAEGFIIVFTSNTCPFSIANEDRIIALDKKYKKRGYPVIAINPNDPSTQVGDGFKAMQERTAQKKFTFPYLEDNQYESYSNFGATKTPQAFLLQKNEEEDYIVKYTGSIDDNCRSSKAVTKKYLEDAVDALIEGNPIEVTETEAIGCSIKS